MSKSFSWDDMLFWTSGEWDVVQERLENEHHCPRKELLFAALDATPYSDVRVAILGQDPYPNLRHATGISFSVPPRTKPLPPSLHNLFTEYVDDLGYPYPTHGDLSRWCSRGILLWNVYPSCRVGEPASHHWPEWAVLTQEMVEKLDENKIVFVLLGRVARNYRNHIWKSNVIETSHPSPLGARQGFLGSRIYSKVNKELKEPVDWRL